MLCRNYRKCESRRDFLLTQLFHAGCIAVAGILATCSYAVFISDDEMSKGLGIGFVLLELVHLALVTLVAAPAKRPAPEATAKRVTLLLLLMAVPFLMKLWLLGMRGFFDLILLPPLLIAALLLAGSWNPNPRGVVLSGLYLSVWTLLSEWLVAFGVTALTELLNMSDDITDLNWSVVLLEFGIIWLGVAVILWRRWKRKTAE